ncbi:MAG TPA: 2-dehydropantoate 2-reductase [Vicinamibacterales bacterium]|jgi:2-dehydropantoate 2-reductase
MRIAVVGAGAVGGYYGGRLAQAGHEVVFIARGTNLRAVRERGVRVRSQLGDFVVAARAEADAALVGAVDLVILAVKTYSNREALLLLPPLVGPDTAVLTLQNGVDSADEVAAVVGAGHVLAGATYIGATLTAPGEIEHVGTVRRIVFGEAAGDRVISERVSRVHEVLAGADIQSEAAADSRIPIWEKFIFLAPVAALTAAARLAVGPAWAQPAFRDAFHRAMGEVEQLARHAGVAVADDVREQKMRYMDNSPATMRSSMMVDLVSGRPLELQALVGTVIRRGRAAAIDTPVMATLYGVLKPFEFGTPQ